jgi:tyrosyl-tRNA synthetase
LEYRYEPKLDNPPARMLAFLYAHCLRILLSLLASATGPGIGAPAPEIQSPRSGGSYFLPAPRASNCAGAARRSRNGVRNDGLIELFARTTEGILSLEEFRALLGSGKKLRVKFGADVTASFLHLGHAVNLWMMREMQERGHLVQFLIGDFTTRVGDPTGRSGARVPPSREAVERDAESFVRQVGRVLITDDSEVFEVRRNSEWWGSMPIGDFLGLVGGVTAGRLLSRDMFRVRMESGGEVRADEMLYPILQGWDSVMLESDLTIVGSDQLFNESMGRMFQERAGQRPQVVITTRITPGLDGVRKQSKTLGNFIAIDDGARAMFGKAMSLPDALIRDWLEVYTAMPKAEIDAICAAEDPRAAKIALAGAIVGRWHGAEAAEAEADWFAATFSRGEFPDDAPVALVPPGDYRALDLLALAMPGSSRSDLRRLVASGAVSVDGEELARVDQAIGAREGEELRIRVGKRRFLRVSAAGGRTPP